MEKVYCPICFLEIEPVRLESFTPRCTEVRFEATCSKCGFGVYGPTEDVFNVLMPAPVEQEVLTPVEPAVNTDIDYTGLTKACWVYSGESILTTLNDRTSGDNFGS